MRDDVAMKNQPPYGTTCFSLMLCLGRYGAETRNLMDEFRKDRTSGDFRPTGDSLLDDDGGK